MWVPSKQGRFPLAAALLGIALVLWAAAITLFPGSAFGDSRGVRLFLSFLGSTNQASRCCECLAPLRALGSADGAGSAVQTARRHRSRQLVHPLLPGPNMKAAAARICMQSASVSDEGVLQQEQDQQRVQQLRERAQRLLPPARKPGKQQKGKPAKAEAETKEQGGGGQQPKKQQQKKKKQRCAIFNNVAYHIDVAAGMAWAFQVGAGQLHLQRSAPVQPSALAGPRRPAALSAERAGRDACAEAGAEAWCSAAGGGVPGDFPHPQRHARHAGKQGAARCHLCCARCCACMHAGGNALPAKI